MFNISKLYTNSDYNRGGRNGLAKLRNRLGDLSQYCNMSNMEAITSCIENYDTLIKVPGISNCICGAHCKNFKVVAKFDLNSMNVELYLVGTSCISHFKGYKPNLRKCCSCKNEYDKIYSSNFCYNCLKRGYRYNNSFGASTSIKDVETRIIKLKLNDDLKEIRNNLPINPVALITKPIITKPIITKPIITKPIITEPITQMKDYRGDFNSVIRDINKLYNYCRPRCYVMDYGIFANYDKKSRKLNLIQSHIFKRWAEYHI